MIHKKKFCVSVVFLFLTVGSTYTLFSDEPPGNRARSTNLSTVSQTRTAAVLNINNLVSWYWAHGQGQYGPPNLQGNGSAFPRGTSHPFFADGFVWGAKAYLDSAHTMPAPFQFIRVGGGTYNVGNQIGWIIGTGANAQRVDPADPRARIYRIRRDYTTMSGEELARDALENFYWGGTLNQVTDADKSAITAQYATDWNEWPTDFGAPYIERNGTPGYQQPPAFGSNFTVDSLISGNYDEPGLAGSVVFECSV
jgi:hypothetical protein